MKHERRHPSNLGLSTFSIELHSVCIALKHLCHIALVLVLRASTRPETLLVILELKKVLRCSSHDFMVKQLRTIFVVRGESNARILASIQQMSEAPQALH